MSRPKRTLTSGTFFITSVTAQRRRLFLHASKAELFLETLQHYRRNGLYKLHAFVVMPDHVHLLMTTNDLPGAMKHLRGGFSRKLPNVLAIWQGGYTDRLIQSREDYLTHLDYIHQNPVRARLCERPEDYPYSSAYRPAEVIPPGTVCPSLHG